MLRVGASLGAHPITQHPTSNHATTGDHHHGWGEPELGRLVHVARCVSVCVYVCLHVRVRVCV